MTTAQPPQSRALFERALQHIPGGVNSPVRAFRSVGGAPLFFASAEGAHMTDVDGTTYVDFVGSWGPMLLGHAHTAVNAAVSDALSRGTSFGAPGPGEVDLAELIVACVPSIEMVRLVNSGTEATMSAVRLARAATERPAMIKFRGGYHGHGDSFLVQAGSGAATLGVPSSPGVTEGTARDTLVADYNDLDSVRACFASRPGEVACVIVEPVSGNMGLVPPEPGFLEGMRELCDETGALLVFDEVMTGFRVALGGAQERYGVRPDLTTLGKVIGGGLPVGAYGGSRELMGHIAPSGPVYQAGTLSGNPLSVAAGAAMLRALMDDPHVYDRLESLGQQLDAGFAEMQSDGLGPLTWNRVGAMGSLFFTEGPVRNWDEASAANRERFQAYFWALLEAGFYLPPSPFEAMFLSDGHSESIIDDYLRATRGALQSMEHTTGAAS